MKNKDTQNQLLVAQTTWEILDSLGDKLIEETVEEVASDALSSIPGGTVVMGIYKGIKNYKEKQRFNNFIVFIKNYKTKTEKDISKYLEENPTSELGEYTISMLQELSGPRQTEMLGRATALLLNGFINEEKFFECGYIISKIDPHLFNLITQLSNTRNNSDSIKSGTYVKSYFPNPNMDLASFGFLQEIEQELYPGTLPIARYEKTEKFNWFYENIVKGI